MHPLIETLLLCGLAGAAATTAASSLLVYRRLRIRHPETYGDLGSPGLLLRIPGESRRSVARFIWGGEFRALGDPGLTILVTSLRAATVLAVGLFLLCVVKVLFHWPG